MVLSQASVNSEFNRRMLKPTPFCQCSPKRSISLSLTTYCTNFLPNSIAKCLSSNYFTFLNKLPFKIKPFTASNFIETSCSKSCNFDKFDVFRMADDGYEIYYEEMKKALSGQVIVLSSNQFSKLKTRKIWTKTKSAQLLNQCGSR